MDHLQNTPLHWGYSGTNNTASWAPAASIPRGLKRPLSDSDCEDVYSEGSSSKDQCTSPGDSDSCQMMSRKKRRGVIEKKRRDRINTSLAELKRLVPSAFEKQGSAKLEKAEILQMTVDHLKMIHSKGLDSFAYDPHKYAMDYHGMGYRECASEVTRYLERIEGLDIQNPLRLRLTSHLQCCAAQRELAKQPTNSWTSGYGNQTYPQPPPLIPLPPSPGSNHTTHAPVHPHSHTQHQNMHEPHFTDLSTATATSATATTPASSVLTPLTTASAGSLGMGYGQYPVNVNSFIPTSHHQGSYHQSGSTTTQGGGMKPYRPWGAEVAY